MADETKPEVDLSSVSMQALTAELEKRFRETQDAQKRLGVHFSLVGTNAVKTSPRAKTTKAGLVDKRTNKKSPTWYQGQHSRRYHEAAAKHDQTRMDLNLAKLKELGLPLLSKKKKTKKKGNSAGGD